MSEKGDRSPGPFDRMRRQNLGPESQAQIEDPASVCMFADHAPLRQRAGTVTRGDDIQQLH